MGRHSEFVYLNIYNVFNRLYSGDRLVYLISEHSDIFV